MRTEQEAQIALGRLLEQAADGKRPDSRVTVGELLVQYLEVAELDVSTRHTYEGYIRRTIGPALGGVELRKVRGPMLDTFYARLRRCSDVRCTGRSFSEQCLDSCPRARRAAQTRKNAKIAFLRLGGKCAAFGRQLALWLSGIQAL
ncbi:MAG: hypothetical protein ACYCPF_12660 [Streptosporangiaceae bacterium]